ncbi:hypothetical protein X975_23813, partial [Stegodyphus mimosarum]
MAPQTIPPGCQSVCQKSQVGITPLSRAPPDSPSLVIGAQFKVGLITEDYSTPVSDIPGRMSPTPLQKGSESEKDTKKTHITERDNGNQRSRRGHLFTTLHKYHKI